jgi:hypothetical protein
MRDLRSSDSVAKDAELKADLRFTRLRTDRKLLEQARLDAGDLVAYEGPLDDEVTRMFGGADVTQA